MDQTMSPKSLVRTREKSKLRGQRVAKRRKTTSELGESSEGLPPKEEVSFSSNLGEKVTMKIVKLGPLRLNLSEASELAESSTRVPPIREVGGASDFKEKEVIQVGKLTRVNTTSRTVRVKKRSKPRQKS
ncbi:hypothetical protein PVK06_031542 [Gossypium arboreum]|uniref:Uncharacterized protein n=1 Tax=Gossypium arboreum TaxID=29729 RepID=A0ABR0NRE2_GOSAR|nr:hypothetical protein PVK06_031542 [Gossypium arboreum]